VEKSRGGDLASFADLLDGLALGPVVVELESVAAVEAAAGEARSDSSGLEGPTVADFCTLVLSAARALVLLARAPGRGSVAGVLRPLMAAVSAGTLETVGRATGTLSSTSPSSSLKMRSMDDWNVSMGGTYLLVDITGG
jgi:hypothetical protein